jgi:hypothetical protein
MAWTSDSIVVATDDQVSTSVGGDAVILGMKDGIYYGLDAVGARIWELVRTPRRVADLVSILTAEFDVDAERCERDLLALLRELETRNLVRASAPGE